MIPTAPLAPDAYFPPSGPPVTEVGKYLVISMGSDANVGRAFQMSNTEIGADRKIISTASDPGCPTNGGFPDLTGQFAAGRWNLTTDPDSLNLAATLFQGTDWSGEVALTSSGGKTDSSNSLVFADIGIQSASSDPLGGSVSSSYHFDLTENAPCSNADPLVLGDGATANNNFTPLLTQLTAWKTYITGLAAEVTINNYSAWTNNAASNGNGGLRTNYDSNDTNGDGIVVINLADTGNDFSVNNTDWVINGSGSKLIIFRLTGGRNMVMSNASITLGDSGIANGGMGVIFYTSYKGSGNTDAVFSGSNLIASGVGFWDLNVVGQGGSTGTNIVINNGQGCAQFISQKVNFQNNRWNRCAPVAAQAADLVIVKTDSPDPVGLGQNLSYTLLITNTGPGAATGVVVADTLPAGVTYVSATPSQGTCSQSSGVVSCNLNSLANGASATVTVVTTVSSSYPVFGLGNLTDYLMFFANGSEDANWQGATKGFVGDVAVDGIQADERTSGGVPYAGTIYTNDSTLSAWAGIVDQNDPAQVSPAQAFASTGQTSRITGLESDLANAFAQINALAVTSGYASVASTSLDGLNTQNGRADTYVINVTSGFQVSSQINITGDAGDVFILRWDEDANFSDGYEGTVKFQSGGVIVPLGGLTPANFVHVAGVLNSSGGGSNPASPYPQGPRYNNGFGSLIVNGSNFSGGGFFTGYWLTTGDPADGNNGSLSNGIFVGGWYTLNDNFSMTSGTSGVYVEPSACLPGEIYNLASVSANEADPNQDNNDDFACTEVSSAAIDVEKRCRWLGRAAPGWTPTAQPAPRPRLAARCTSASR